jgi:hypothetical protein
MFIHPLSINISNSGMFRLFKEKEINQFGEHRTRGLVLEAWEGVEPAPAHIPATSDKKFDKLNVGIE